jgi:hypothetical protein
VVKRILKILIFLPLLLWISLIGSCVIKQYNLDRVIKEPDGLTWAQNSDSLSVNVRKDITGEVETIVIRITNPAGTNVHVSTMDIDHDMWGGGFVKAVDVDSDGTLEVMAYGIRERKTSFYLDFQNGEIRKKFYGEWPDYALRLVEDWRTVHFDYRMGGFLLFFPVAGFYLLYGLIRLIYGLVKRRRKSKPAIS